MTSALWFAIGLTVSAALLYGALAVTRPREAKYLSFACMMALLAAYMFFEWSLYRATTSDAVVEAVRRQVIAGHGVLASILVFVPAYTNIRIPRWLHAIYWAALAIFFVANLWAPYGIWFSAEPTLDFSTFGGERYTAHWPRGWVHSNTHTRCS